jgi:LPS-assembly lipoprotein
MQLLTALLLLAALLAGCGFRLQSAAELPAEMAQTQIISGDIYDPMIRRLSILLEQNGARVVTGNDATAILEIPLNVVRKDILSIGDSARVREYRLVHQVRFRLLDANQQVLVAEQFLEQTRVISFDEQDILAATREEEFLREELAETLSRQVLRRLGTPAVPAPQAQ